MRACAVGVALAFSVISCPRILGVEGTAEARRLMLVESSVGDVVYYIMLVREHVLSQTVMV